MYCQVKTYFYICIVFIGFGRVGSGYPWYLIKPLHPAFLKHDYGKKCA